MKTLFAVSVGILLISTTATAAHADSSAETSSKYILELLQPLAQEHINVLMLFKLTQGVLPTDIPSFDAFIQRNHLNIENKYWHYCSISSDKDGCTIRIQIDSLHPSPAKMSDSSIITKANILIGVVDFMKGEKSSIVTLMRALASATITNAQGTQTKLNSFVDSKYTVLSRLSKETLERLTKKD